MSGALGFVGDVIGTVGGFMLGGPIGAAIGAGASSLLQGKPLHQAFFSGLGAYGGAKLFAGIPGALSSSGSSIASSIAGSSAFGAISPYLGHIGAVVGSQLAPRLLHKIPKPPENPATNHIIPPPPKLPELRQQVADVVKIKFTAPELKLNNPLDKETIAPKLQKFNKMFGSTQLKNKRNIYNAPHFKPFKQLVKNKTLPKHLFKLQRQGLTTNARTTS